MKNIIILSLLFTSLTTLQSSCQEKETYYRIKTIYREDHEPFVGLTAMSMEEILDYNFHFVRKNGSLHFDYPKKLEINLDSFTNLKQLDITEKDYYEMYDYTFHRSSFLIKFKDNATSSKSKNTIIEFEKVDKEQYDQDIAEAFAYEREVQNKIISLKASLKKQPPIKLLPLEKLTTKVDTIFDDTYDSDIILQIPEQIALYESGDLKNEKFGDIKIGTFKDHSKIYDIEHAEDYGLKQLTIWVSTDPAGFDMKKFVAGNENMVLVKEEKDNVVGYTISYDFEHDQAIIGSFFSLKYYQVGKTHLFIYGNVTASQMKNAPHDVEMNKILNFNYLISEHITLISNN